MVGNVFHEKTVDALAMALLEDSIARREAKRDEFRSQMARLVPIQGQIFVEDVMSDEDVADAFAEVMGDE